jgi:hypothetical protein
VTRPSGRKALSSMAAPASSAPLATSRLCVLEHAFHPKRVSDDHTVEAETSRRSLRDRLGEGRWRAGGVESGDGDVSGHHDGDVCLDGRCERRSSSAPLRRLWSTNGDRDGCRRGCRRDPGSASRWRITACTAVQRTAATTASETCSGSHRTTGRDHGCRTSMLTSATGAKFWLMPMAASSVTVRARPLRPGQVTARSDVAAAGLGRRWGTRSPAPSWSAPMSSPTPRRPLPPPAALGEVRDLRRAVDRAGAKDGAATGSRGFAVEEITPRGGAADTPLPGCRRHTGATLAARCPRDDDAPAP